MTSPNQHTAGEWADRWLARVDTTGDCWLWTGRRDGKGYGHLSVLGKDWTAYRLSYALHNGDIPDGAFICHTCDNPPCVNPAHLYAGTPRTNSRDCLERGRHVSLRGAACGKARLSVETVRAIRQDYATGRYTQAELGRKYGAGQPHVSSIVRRKVWVDD